MGTAPPSRSDTAFRIASAGRRCAELIHRVSLSQAIVSSALEVPTVSAALTENMRQRHLSGETGVRDILKEYKLIVPIEAGKPFELDKVMALVADGLAKQTAINAELVISAAVVILSHSTADDVFTEVCKLAIDLDPDKWIPQLDPERKVSLQLLRDKGEKGVFEEELLRFKARLGGQSLPNRARLLFKQVPIVMHSEIPRTDPTYFKLSTLKEADELRIDLVHRNGLPNVNPASGSKFAGFLHEAARTALRSVGSAYSIPWDVEYWKSSIIPKTSTVAPPEDPDPNQ